MTSQALTDFENRLHLDLHQYLQNKQAVEERMPECPDVEAAWPALAQAYLPDGIREFNDYPNASLGWCMYLGMALAHFWDSDWARCTDVAALYRELREARGYDCLDEYIAEEVLHTPAPAQPDLGHTVAACASRTLSLLRHAPFEAGTPEAFHAYVACLHQLFLMGMALQLKTMGYHTERIQ